MNTQRRSFLPALAVVPIALAGCALTPANAASVQQAINFAQGVLSGASMLTPFLAAFVPASTPFIGLLETGLNAASNIFAGVSSAMTVAQSQPVIGKVGTAINVALNSADTAAALIPDPTQRTKVQTVINAVRADAGLLVQFAVDVNATQPAAEWSVVARGGSADQADGLMPTAWFFFFPTPKTTFVYITHVSTGQVSPQPTHDGGPQ